MVSFHNCFETDAMSIKFLDNKIVCGRLMVKYPKYTHIKNIVEDVVKENTELKKKYFLMNAQLSHGHKVDKGTYNKIVDAIKKNETTLQELLDSSFIDDASYDDIVRGIQEITEEQRTMIATTSVHDARLAQKMAELQRNKMILYMQLKKVAQYKWREFVKEGEYKVVNRVHDNIQTSPQRPHDQPNTRQNPSAPPERKKVPRKKAVVINEEQKVEIKRKIKDLLKDVYKFKDKSECVSKQRTKDFFMSKDAILESIDNNPELKKLMPSNYKSFTKDQLCSYFFE